MTMSNSASFQSEIIIDTQEIIELLKKLTTVEKERLYFMMKGIELVSDNKCD